MNLPDACIVIVRYSDGSEVESCSSSLRRYHALYGTQPGTDRIVTAERCSCSACTDEPEDERTP